MGLGAGSGLGWLGLAVISSSFSNRLFSHTPDPGSYAVYCFAFVLFIFIVLCFGSLAIFGSLANTVSDQTRQKKYMF